MKYLLPCFLAVILGAVNTTAHPGADVAEEVAALRSFYEHSKRDLSHCAEHLQARGHVARQVVRRHQLAQAIRTAEGLVKRELSDINKTHHVDEHYTVSTPAEILFSSNNSCVLSPETIEGPYYVSGEFVRKDLTDGQGGVPMYVETQVIDIETCEPVSNIYVEIWSCNATGVYSGVTAVGNGNSNDTSNLDATFLRGIQPTDNDGTSVFKTIFPGHYTGRTMHIHTMAHTNATMLPNGTIRNTIASHSGQMFIDQDLIYEVEALSPYTANAQVLTLNSGDDILATAANGSDPMMEWVYLGDKVSDGIFAWLAFGVNQSYVRDVSAAAFLYAEGGVTNPDASFPPPGMLPPTL